MLLSQGRENISPVPSNSPALQLVSEIFESLKVKNVKVDQKKEGDPTEPEERALTKASSMEGGPNSQDNFENFKSRLRKVSKSLDGGNEAVTSTAPTADLKSIPLAAPVVEGDENGEHNGKEKRSSTGSITSLKKMWEGQQQQQQQQQQARVETNSKQQQPKNPNSTKESEGLSSRHKPVNDFVKLKTNSPEKSSEERKKDDKLSKSKKSVEGGEKHSTNSKTDGTKVTRVKRVWPPVPSSAENDHKPAIPSKPMTAKKTNPIYATPSQRQDYSSRSK